MAHERTPETKCRIFATRRSVNTAIGTKSRCGEGFRKQTRSTGDKRQLQTKKTTRGRNSSDTPRDDSQHRDPLFDGTNIKTALDTGETGPAQLGKNRTINPLTGTGHYAMSGDGNVSPRAYHLYQYCSWCGVSNGYS